MAQFLWLGLLKHNAHLLHIPLHSQRFRVMLKLFPPTIIHYSDDIPDGVGGYAKLFYARIRTKYEGTDLGILMHELLHVRQFYILLLAWLALCFAGVLLAPEYSMYGYSIMPLGLLVHPLLYTFVTEYKLDCEVACYQEQALHYPDDRLPRFAGYISKSYGLTISEEDALKLLREK